MQCNVNESALWISNPPWDRQTCVRYRWTIGHVNGSNGRVSLESRRGPAEPDRRRCRGGVTLKSWALDGGDGERWDSFRLVLAAFYWISMV